MTGPVADPKGEIVVHETSNGDFKFEVLVGDETVWLTLEPMADPLNRTSQNVVSHISNGYREGELSKMATAEDSSVVAIEGGRQVKRKVRQLDRLPTHALKRFWRALVWARATRTLNH